MNTIVAKLINDLNLSVAGDIYSPNEGRIAKNYIVPTKEKGEVLLRIRSLISEAKDSMLEYGPERFVFEANTIDFFAQTNLPVPALLRFKSSGTTLYKDNQQYAFSYPLLDGAPIDINEIDERLAEQVGYLMANFVNAATSFKPPNGAPDGDIDYINRILTAYTKADPESARDEHIELIFRQLNNDANRALLEATPRGICHGDFFFENVIKKDDKIVGLIDFGDAYFGNVLMDIATASMEFSVKENGALDEKRLRAFLYPLASWLRSNQIDFDLYHYALLANCARFTAHTLSLALAAGEKGPVAENPYVCRFLSFAGQAKPVLQESFVSALEKTQTI